MKEGEPKLSEITPAPKQQIDRKAPIQEQLDKAKKDLEEIKNKVRQKNEQIRQSLVKTLGIDETVTEKRIFEDLWKIKDEIKSVSREKSDLENDIHFKRANLPVVGTDPKTGSPKLMKVQVPEGETKERFERLAYGGTSFIERTRQGEWPRMSTGTLEDNYALSHDRVAFGVGEKEGKRFLILRQRQNIQNRGGYPYTILLDPGKKVWEKAGYNGALIIRNILADPVLRDYVLNCPEEVKKELPARLEQSHMQTSADQNLFSRTLMRRGGTKEKPDAFGPSSVTEPTPEQMAQVMEALSIAERKEFTFLIRGGAVNAKVFGAKTVWDPELEK